MPDHQTIYHSEADRYDQLVSREDYQGHILKGIQDICPIQSCDVIELGAGTGRITCLVAPLVKSIRAFDESRAMLHLAAAKLQQTSLQNWQVGVADHRQIPVEDSCADLVLSGWSVCYVVVWNPEHWQVELERALKEMQRLLRPGGWIILLETLGTGFETPQPPAHLLPYYQYLETYGFQRSWIRTDYRFDNLLQGEELSRFFFGEETVQKIELNERGVILPECTGIWWLHNAGENK
jgi:ubiquinone/menaquinone biosynthesis C-methylase UbiE